MSAAEEAWPAAWSRVALPTVILAVLQDGPRHGYAVATQVEDRGFGRPRGGSLYPLLGRLEEEGLVESNWEPGGGGPGRRAYRITVKGRDRLAGDRSRWAALTAALGPGPHRGDAGTQDTQDIQGTHDIQEEAP